MIRLIACGKAREKWMKLAIDEYAKRIGSYDKIELVEVQDEQAPDSNSDAENEQVKKIEAERILKLIKPQDYVILLDLHGQTCDSVALAKKIEALYTYGSSRICFVIGGSLGLGKELIERSNERWKLSDNTFPHQLCRILVLEQIYRAFRIMKNEPYHK